jgi:hypothetical protein
MTYKINPCKACSNKFKNTDCNINDLNNCYIETVSAYRNYPNNFVALDGIDSNWESCMSSKMAQLPYVAGKPRTFCNFQLNRAPVFTGDHFFPSQLEKNNGNVKNALTFCKLDCQKVKNKLECIENCEVDNNALELLSNNNTKVDNSTKVDRSNIYTNKNFSNTSLPNYIIIIVISFLFIILLYFIIYRINKNSTN